MGYFVVTSLTDLLIDEDNEIHDLPKMSEVAALVQDEPSAISTAEKMAMKTAIAFLMQFESKMSRKVFDN